jgi:replication initiation and membrane attachment protein
MAYYLEVPDLFRDQGDIHQYNAFLRNEPYTLVLQKFFPNGRVPDGVLNIFEKIDLQYRLNEEVINVLIHYIHAGRRSWSKASIETVAADMLGKQISTYEQAVQYVREQLEYRSKASASKRAAGTRGARGGKQKPSIPMIRQEQPDTPLTEEELAQIREKAKRLDGNVK